MDIYNNNKTIDNYEYLEFCQFSNSPQIYCSHHFGGRVSSTVNMWNKSKKNYKNKNNRLRRVMYELDLALTSRVNCSITDHQLPVLWWAIKGIDLSDHSKDCFLSNTWVNTTYFQNLLKNCCLSEKSYRKVRERKNKLKNNV